MPQPPSALEITGGNLRNTIVLIAPHMDDQLAVVENQHRLETNVSNIVQHITSDRMIFVPVAVLEYRKAGLEADFHPVRP